MTDRRITRAEYQDLLALTRRATTPPRPPRIAATDLRGRLWAVLPDRDTLSTALDNLVATDQLVRYSYEMRPEKVPADQRPRTWYSVADDRWLRDWIHCEAQTDAPDQELIGELNTLRQELDT